MTKEEFSDLVTSIWEGGEVTSQRKPDPREIWLLADAAMGELIYNDFKETSNIDGRFFTSEVLNVNLNTERNKKYITLTSAPLLSPKGNAVVLISPVQDDTDQFIMITPIRNFFKRGRERVDNKTYFWLENKTVFFDNLPLEYSKLLSRSVKAIADLASNETIPIAEHILNSVLDIVLQKVGIQKKVADKAVNIYKDGA